MFWWTFSIKNYSILPKEKIEPEGPYFMIYAKFVSNFRHLLSFNKKKSSLICVKFEKRLGGYIMEVIMNSSVRNSTKKSTFLWFSFNWDLFSDFKSHLSEMIIALCIVNTKYIGFHLFNTKKLLYFLLNWLNSLYSLFCQN